MRRISWKAILVAAILLAEVGVLSAVAFSAGMEPMNGIAVRKDAASITMSDQHNVVHTIVVDRVVAPADGWLIVQADWNDNVADAVLGSAWVPAGESSNVQISLDSQATLPRHVFVTLLADKGMPHVLEFQVPMRAGMQQMRGMGSTTGTGTLSAMESDPPVVAGGQLVQAHVALSAQSFAVGVDQASISETTRSVDATEIVVPRVMAPSQSWVSASLVGANGQIAQVLGETLVHSGESTHVVIPLSAPPGSGQIVLTLHVDLGTVGTFDFSPSDLGNSFDQPYVAGGQTVATRVTLVR